MTQEGLKKILHRHQLWMENKEGGEQADLRGANLRWINLHGANLYEADLCEADLHGANLNLINLQCADLYGANLFRAVLQGADLRGAALRSTDLSAADLRGADLQGADLDYSCWPLWRGSLDVTVDKRIAAQLAYHFCRVICDDPEVKAAQEAIKGLANQFHHINECGRIE